MKLYTINPLYTSLYLLIVFAVYVSSIELFVLDGREYLNYKYEIIFGGPKVLMNIEGATFGGVKRVRPLSPDEILELKEKRSKQKEIERKQVEEKRQREQGEKERDQEEKEKKKKGEEEEIKRKYRSRQEEIKMGQQQRKTQRIKEQKERDAKKALREAKTVKPNAKQQIRRTLSNKQNTPLNRLSRRNNING